MSKLFDRYSDSDLLLQRSRRHKKLVSCRLSRWIQLQNWSRVSWRLSLWLFCHSSHDRVMTTDNHFDWSFDWNEHEGNDYDMDQIHDHIISKKKKLSEYDDIISSLFSFVIWWSQSRGLTSSSRHFLIHIIIITLSSSFNSVSSSHRIRKYLGLLFHINAFTRRQEFVLRSSTSVSSYRSLVSSSEGTLFLTKTNNVRCPRSRFIFKVQLSHICCVSKNLWNRLRYLFLVIYAFLRIDHREMLTEMK